MKYIKKQNATNEKMMKIKYSIFFIYRDPTSALIIFNSADIF